MDNKIQKILKMLMNPTDNLRERSPVARLFMNELPTFVVNSGNWSKYLSLSLRSAEKFPVQIAEFLELPKVRTLDYSSEFPETVHSRKLATLFNHEGSDKARHGYERIYTKILGNFPEGRDINLLEIGIGTNSHKLISSMGRKGKPGASLYSFAKFDSRINVTGADIDKNILVKGDRIRSFYLDQTNLDTYFDLSRDSGKKHFNVIIDDGLHSTEANINSLIFAKNHLSEGGYLLIEDIPDRSLAVWNLLLGILENQGHDVSIVRASNCNVVLYRQSLQANRL